MGKRYNVTALAPLGWILRDMPGAESEGAKRVTAVKRTTKLLGLDVREINRVPYVEVVSPVNPTATLWGRIAEADGNIVYAEVTLVKTEDPDPAPAQSNFAELVQVVVKGFSDVVQEIRHLTTVLEKIANK